MRATMASKPTMEKMTITYNGKQYSAEATNDMSAMSEACSLLLVDLLKKELVKSSHPPPPLRRVFNDVWDKFNYLYCKNTKEQQPGKPPRYRVTIRYKDKVYAGWGDRVLDGKYKALIYAAKAELEANPEGRLKQRFQKEDHPEEMLKQNYGVTLQYLMVERGKSMKKCVAVGTRLLDMFFWATAESAEEAKDLAATKVVRWLKKTRKVPHFFLEVDFLMWKQAILSKMVATAGAVDCLERCLLEESTIAPPVVQSKLFLSKRELELLERVSSGKLRAGMEKEQDDALQTLEELAPDSAVFSTSTVLKSDGKVTFWTTVKIDDKIYRGFGNSADEAKQMAALSALGQLQASPKELEMDQKMLQTLADGRCFYTYYYSYKTFVGFGVTKEEAESDACILVVVDQLKAEEAPDYMKMLKDKSFNEVVRRIDAVFESKQDGKKIFSIVHEDKKFFGSASTKFEAILDACAKIIEGKSEWPSIVEAESKVEPAMEEMKETGLSKEEKNEPTGVADQPEEKEGPSVSETSSDSPDLIIESETQVPPEVELLEAAEEHPFDILEKHCGPVSCEFIHSKVSHDDPLVNTVTAYLTVNGKMFSGSAQSKSRAKFLAASNALTALKRMEKEKPEPDEASSSASNEPIKTIDQLRYKDYEAYLEAKEAGLKIEHPLNTLRYTHKKNVELLPPEYTGKATFVQTIKVDNTSYKGYGHNKASARYAAAWKALTYVELKLHEEEEVECKTISESKQAEKMSEKDQEASEMVLETPETAQKSNGVEKMPEKDQKASEIVPEPKEGEKLPEKDQEVIEPVPETSEMVPEPKEGEKLPEKDQEVTETALETYETVQKPQETENLPEKEQEAPEMVMQASEIVPEPKEGEKLPEKDHEVTEPVPETSEIVPQPKKAEKLPEQDQEATETVMETSEIVSEPKEGEKLPEKDQKVPEPVPATSETVPEASSSPSNEPKKTIDQLRYKDYEAYIEAKESGLKIEHPLNTLRYTHKKNVELLPPEYAGKATFAQTIKVDNTSYKGYGHNKASARYAAAWKALTYVELKLHEEEEVECKTISESKQVEMSEKDQEASEMLMEAPETAQKPNGVEKMPEKDQKASETVLDKSEILPEPKEGEKLPEQDQGATEMALETYETVQKPKETENLPEKDQEAPEMVLQAAEIVPEPKEGENKPEKYQEVTETVPETSEMVPEPKEGEKSPEQDQEATETALETYETVQKPKETENLPEKDQEAPEMVLQASETVPEASSSASNEPKKVIDQLRYKDYEAYIEAKEAGLKIEHPLNILRYTHKKNVELLPPEYAGKATFAQTIKVDNTSYKGYGHNKASARYAAAWKALTYVELKLHEEEEVECKTISESKQVEMSEKDQEASEMLMEAPETAQKPNGVEKMPEKDQKASETVLDKSEILPEPKEGEKLPEQDQGATEMALETYETVQKPKETENLPEKDQEAPEMVLQAAEIVPEPKEGENKPEKYQEVTEPVPETSEIVPEPKEGEKLPELDQEVTKTAPETYETVQKPQETENLPEKDQEAPEMILQALQIVENASKIIQEELKKVNVALTMIQCATKAPKSKTNKSAENAGKPVEPNQNMDSPKEEDTISTKEEEDPSMISEKETKIGGEHIDKKKY